MTTNSLFDPLQSAYRSAHSTETAVTKIHNDILSSLDQGRCTILASLDLSAAFDTVDHHTFTHRLRHYYGIHGTAAQWFESYLANRHHQVSINNQLSTTHTLTCGVPQGSVLGARMYTMYTHPLSIIMKNHNVMYHSYADDTQIYTQCDNNEISRNNATKCLQNCIADVCKWMAYNSLKINEDKTEFIVFCAKSTTIGNISLQVGDNSVRTKDDIKILGVTFDSKLTLQKQISTVCRSSYMQIRKINSIRQYLSETAVRTLVQATVTVKFDYCNIVYTGLPLKDIHRLQLMQNCAARMISKTSRYEHITPILRQLHWLPMSKRCQYKTLITTYKSLHCTTPEYICDMLNWYTPTRPLRSAFTTSLVPNKNKTVRYGKRLFDTSAATLWNTLPIEIKSIATLQCFKTQIKTLLFSR